ncbi:hypothetical protein K466DRAFT_261391 [Polyporus arcularius HHB13444]|uniref:Uncharacterized protein n=1 Tax=Polyporus arcularius HHB13444 TaxID=1314778 RepID=A0A5C3PQJ3_9APHY|nr:hypothetical protein K466DRAFT_261391 [Polyporus arcularius HHB13444]
MRGAKLGSANAQHPCPQRVPGQPPPAAGVLLASCLSARPRLRRSPVRHFYIDFRCPRPSRRHAQRTSGSNPPPPPPLTLPTLSTIAPSRPEILLASRLALRNSASDHPPPHSTLDDQERPQSILRSVSTQVHARSYSPRPRIHIHQPHFPSPSPYAPPTIQILSRWTASIRMRR